MHNIELNISNTDRFAEESTILRNLSYSNGYGKNPQKKFPAD